ncbi:hypothetical protein SCLCIDRAFT_28423 [Scleroderma citrinum Foug A]|uniref:CCHC-type domain-containing protein n=1 Tax=Scleroderma citrinum Foug A TaxID=1036808 RepID=A0A0C3A048_9AGAM|nr:hypothetical protein SCLCIDRAFT_28423 [Scleroderma citrinum Foug A]
MANWDDIILQLTNGQQALHNTLQQYIAMQGGAGPTHPKKIVPVPKLYDRSPQKFHEWWSKVKGPQQRIDNFLAQFQALKVQSACPNEYAKDLLERAVQQKVLKQVVAAVRTVGRAQELFLINTATLTQYFSTNNYASSSTPSGSGAPMDISAANTRPQCGKGIQCYNCQGFGHISCECTQPRWAWQQGPQQGWAVQPQVDPNNDNERVKAYASLVVEDVDTECTTDCVDTSASFVSSSTVPSTGVPRSGSAPDVKRGVLNSHVSIKGQKFPSLASSDLESPTDDLEVGFPVELRSVESNTLTT